jgi:hypothetical protein
LSVLAEQPGASNLWTNDCQDGNCG